MPRIAEQLVCKAEDGRIERRWLVTWLFVTKLDVPSYFL